MSEKDHVFVFGSNLAGRHGKGAALAATHLYGAKLGVGWGRQGSSYAIPTKDEKLRTLDLQTIRAWCWAFIEHARANPQDTFIITPVGCGLAGYKRKQIRPFFRHAPKNCIFHGLWDET